VIAIIGLGLASLDTPRHGREPANWTPFVRPAPPFFIGAWVGPRTNAPAAEWRRFKDAGLEVSFRPLEDPNDRAANVRTLARLDSLGLSMLPRDGAVDPDETERPGWRERVHDVVEAYKSHRSTFGYFVADEPGGKAIDSSIRLAAAFHEEDPARSAYVNLLPVDEAAQQRWRDLATRFITEGKVSLWSWSAYSQRRSGEDATFLLTLRNALEVGRATGVPAIAILQFTGFLDLDPMPRAQMDYESAEAIAHGARGIVWFTWWTPNPQGPEGPWSGGAVEYDGTPSARADTLTLVNARARRLAALFPCAPPPRVAHFGSPMPRGSFVRSDRIRGLVGVDGGPATVAASGDRSRWLVINRDRSRAHTLTVRLDHSTGVASVIEPDSARTHVVDPKRRSIVLALEPGGSALLGIVSR
jgi:hypothetical protein